MNNTSAKQLNRLDDDDEFRMSSTHDDEFIGSRTIIVPTDDRVEVQASEVNEAKHFYRDDHVLVSQNNGKWTILDPADESYKQGFRKSALSKKIEWAGVVDKVGASTFEARLRSVHGSSDDQIEFAEFDLDDVQTGDRMLVVPGGIFRWTIGTSSYRGTKEKFSSIYFRRLPAWSTRSLEESTKTISNLISDLEWE
jgi:hypothetical protein